MRTIFKRSAVGLKFELPYLKTHLAPLHQWMSFEKNDFKITITDALQTLYNWMSEGPFHDASSFDPLTFIYGSACQKDLWVFQISAMIGKTQQCILNGFHEEVKRIEGQLVFVGRPPNPTSMAQGLFKVDLCAGSKPARASAVPKMPWVPSTSP